MVPDAKQPAVPVSVIIPTLNEEKDLVATLDALARARGPIEVIIVDGGSQDRTLEVARRPGVRTLTAARGRGIQLKAGAQEARGGVLWFLHADTVPPPDACERIVAALRDPGVVAGYFTLRFDGPRKAAGFLTRLYPWLRWLGLCYGDSAIFVRREDYDHVGGFQPYPIFEDVDLLRRLRRRGRLLRVPATVVTSSRRFEGRSFAYVFGGWCLLQLLYWLGVPPERLGRVYRPIRGR